MTFTRSIVDICRRSRSLGCLHLKTTILIPNRRCRRNLVGNELDAWHTMHHLRVARVILIDLDHVIIGYSLVLGRGYKHRFGPLGILPLLEIAASTLLSIRCNSCRCRAPLVFLQLPCTHILGQKALIAHILGLALD